jgi:hypothetical protein
LSGYCHLLLSWMYLAIGYGLRYGLCWVFDVYGRNVRDTSFWNPEKQISEDFAGQPQSLG